MASETSELTAIVLAAGQGTRMRSALPKPLHEVCGRSMLAHVLAALGDVAPTRVIVVVGRGAEAVTGSIDTFATPFPVVFAEQAEQLGTGHAVQVALEAYPESGPGSEVVILPGDTPLLRPATLERLVGIHRSSGAAGTLLTARLDDPTGYGRIIRSVDEQVTGIVEQADATAEQAAIDEVGTSIYAFDRARLEEALAQISPNNAQGEWYLTDVIGVFASGGARVGAWVMEDPTEAQGVNDRVQLAAAGAVLQQRINEAWLRAGVSIVNPATTHIDVTVELSHDVTIHPGAVVRGRTRVAAGCEIGPNVCIDDATIGEGALVGASAVIEPGARVEPGSVVPPLAHLGGSAAHLAE